MEDGSYNFPDGLYMFEWETYSFHAIHDCLVVRFVIDWSHLQS